jgi:Spy/CpxP family protein refolding chaperone
MIRRTWAGPALAVTCALAFAGAAWAQGEWEAGDGPEAGDPDPVMEMPGPCGMGPGGPLMGGRGPGMGMRGPGGPVVGVRGPGFREWERLGLSGEQRRRLAELRDVEERRVIRLEADLRLAQLDLRRLVAGERPDLRAIGGQVDRVVDLRGEIMKARLAAQVGMRELLTPEQRARLREGAPGARPRDAQPDRAVPERSPARRQPSKAR